MKRAALFAAGSVLLVAALAAANLARSPDGVELDWALIRPKAPEVVAEPPARGEVVQTVAAPGKVEAVREAQIASQLIGRVLEVHVKEGAAVKKGDVLLRLDDTDARARLDSARSRIARLRAAIDQSENDLAKAHRDADQSGKLAGRGFTTPTEVADARTALSKALSGLAMSKHEMLESEAMRTSAQQELDHTVIRAPIDGVVSGLDVDPGEVVIAGTTNLPGSVLMSVSDLKQMRVRAEVDETDVPLVGPGQVARVFLQADQLHSLPGKVDLVAPKGKAKGEVIEFETLVDLEVQAGGALRPGMSATVEIEVRRAADALGVPAQAVVHRRRKDLPDTPAVRDWAEKNARSPGEKSQDAELRYIKLVFVVEGNVARARPVVTGLSDERRVEIVSGVGPGDRVIVAPFRALDELKDGQTVAVKGAVEPAPPPTRGRP